MKVCPQVIASFGALLLLLPFAVLAQTQEPRVQQSEIQWLGAFRLPSSGTGPNSRFGYGGMAPAYYKDSANRETLWTMSYQFKGNNVSFAGATFDPATNRVFITESNGEDPIVHVLKITTTADTTPPSGPTNLRVE